MADFNRTFKKNTVLDLIQGDPLNGNPNGELKRDSPEFKVVAYWVNARTKKLNVEVNFIAPQGTEFTDDTRTFNIDLTTVPAAVRNRFKDEYNFIVDNIAKAFPELADGIEI